MSDRHYYLGPWVLDETEPLAPFWHAPEGAVGMLDLRNGNLEGLGFFAFNDDRNLGQDYEEFGNGVDRIEECAVSPQRRADWSAMLGIGAVAGPTLLDVVRETFDLYGDPERAIICPPRTPTHLRELNLHLGGHSRIHSERWRGIEHRSWPRVHALIQRNYRAVRSQAKADESAIRSLRQGQRPVDPGYARGMYDRIERDRQRGGGRAFNEQRDALAQYIGETHSRYLTCMSRKYLAPWEILIPPDLPREEPRDPQTTYTESFDQGDSSTLGPDLTWTEVAGDLQTISNRATNVNTNETAYARAEHNLSTDDMLVDFEWYPAGGGGTGRRAYPVTRWDTAALNAYEHQIRGTAESLPRRYDAGTPTNLATATTISFSGGDRHGMKSDGSDQSTLQNGGVIDSVTDTNHTGYLRSGIGLRGPTAATGEGDNFLSEDLTSPPAGHPARKRWGGVAHAAAGQRGVW